MMGGFACEFFWIGGGGGGWVRVVGGLFAGLVGGGVSFGGRGEGRE